MFTKLLRNASSSRLLRSTIAGNTGVLTIGIAAQLALQAISFVVITRTMGVRSYGAFVSVVALAGIAAAFAGWGSDQILIRTVARAPAQFSRALGGALIYFAVSAPVLMVLAIAVIPFLVDASVPLMVVVLVVVSDVVFARANNLAVNCFQSFEHGKQMAEVGLALSAFRTVAALIWNATASDPDPLSWAWFYVGSSALAGALSMAWVVARLGRPIWQVRWADWKDGGFFALQWCSFIGFRDIDKPIVVALAGLPQAGLYAAAFRIADVAGVPVRALMYSTYVRFFQHGASGTRGSLAFARRLVPFGLALGGIAGVAVAAASGFATLILGPDYAGVGTVLLVLTPMPIFYALYYIGADALITGGHIGYRILFQLALPMVDAGLCLILVPRYGAVGAAVAAMLTHAVLVVLVWTGATILARRPEPAK
jgi:O-antigen/teichoic acid export membrane protein